MQVREPLYQFFSQAGKYGWLFALWTTFLLGFVTWHAMYFLAQSSDAHSISPSLPGPASFVSVWIGDFLALPSINALIVLFYSKVSTLEAGLFDMQPSKPRIVGGFLQNSFAAFVALLTTVGIYISWFAANKVDWSIPRPHELNIAGIYHAIFMGVEIYFLGTFILNAAQVFLARPNPDPEKAALTAFQEKSAKALLPVVRIFGIIAVISCVFSASLLADVKRDLIPLSSYFGTVIFTFLPTALGMFFILFGFYRKHLILFLSDIWAPLLLLIAVASVTALLWGF